jgi:hypothetical protein
MTSLMSLGVAEMSSINRGTVSTEQDLRLVGPDRMLVPLTVGLRYTSQDPYAITMSFDAGRDEPVEWTFARDLLAAALCGPEGIGDVRAWPSGVSSAAENGAGADAGSGSGEMILNIVLGPPTGYARFEADAAGIEEFLARTYELVPGGQEPACLTLDAELVDLLGRA